MDSSLYPHIVALIEAYERGLINSIRDNPTDTNAHVLYMSPLRNMEATLEVSETGFESSVFALTEEEEALEEITEVAEGLEEVEARPSQEEDVYYQEATTGAMQDESGKPYSGTAEDLNVFKRGSQPQLELRADSEKALDTKQMFIRIKELQKHLIIFLLEATEELLLVAVKMLGKQILVLKSV